jgi:hypothetical protein
MSKERVVIAKAKVFNWLKTQNKGRYFGITFRKKNGEVRTLNARLGIKSAAGGYQKVGRLDDPYLVVWSNNDRGYRAVNLNTVYFFTMDGKVFYTK